MPSALTVLQAFESVLSPEAPIKAGRAPRRRAEVQVPQLKGYLGLDGAAETPPRVLDAAAKAAEAACAHLHPPDGTWKQFDECPGCGLTLEALLRGVRG